MNDRPGCLSGLLKLFLLDTLFDWLQERFGFRPRLLLLGLRMRVDPVDLVRGVELLRGDGDELVGDWVLEIHQGREGHERFRGE